MVHWIGDRWGELPVWARWVVGVGGVLLFASITTALGERNFIAATAETFVAYLFRYGGGAAVFGIAIWSGIKIAERSRNVVLGWVAGIALFVILGVGLATVGGAIPGVGWRLDQMANSNCYTDWDGRSNPVVCD